MLAFTGLYLAVMAFLGRGAGAGQQVMYFGLLALLIPVLYAVHRRHALGAPLLWCFSFWGLAHLAGGLLPPPGAGTDGELLYSWWLVPGWLRYDQLVHAYGFGITTWLCWHQIRGTLRQPDGSPPRPSVGILGLCVAAGIGFGALNETVEFVTTRFLPKTHIGDFENTGWDLVANLAGALVAAVAIRLATARA